MATNGHYLELENVALTEMRRSRALELAESGYSASRISELLAGEGLVNPETNSAFSLSTIRRDLDFRAERVNIAEMIGRNERSDYYKFRQYHSLYTVDPHRTDYEWWDRFRNGRQPGFELSGLLARPISEIISFYAFGNKPQYSLAINDDSKEQISDSTRLYTNQVIARWVAENVSVLLNMLVDLYCLGDQFVFMNLDGSLSIPSPDTVRVIRDLSDPQRILEVVVTIKFETSLIEEHFTAERRWKVYRLAGQEPVVEQFDNILGMIPMVIFSCNKTGNELFGRPLFEALVGGDRTTAGGLLQWKNELLLKTLEGMRIMGNPIPTFSKVTNVQQTVDANAPATPSTYEDGYGATVSRREIAFDDRGGIVTSGEFGLVTPPVGFSKDMETVDRRLDLLMYSHTHIPEFLWGGAVEASKASTEVQTPPFVVYIGGKRVQLDSTRTKMDGMLALVYLMLVVKRLTDPKVHVGDVQSRYQSITVEEDQIKLQKAIFASNEANPLIDDVETLTLLDISNDPVKSVQKAKEEQKQKLKEQQELMAQQQEDDFRTALNDAAHKEVDPSKQVQSPAGGAQGENA